MSQTALDIKITANGSVVVSAAKEASGAIDGLGRSVARAEQDMQSMARATSSLKAAMAGMGVAATSAEIIKMGDAWLLMQARLNLATGSMQGAKQAQQDLFDLAQKTRAPLEGVVQLYTRLAPAMGQLGKTSQDTLKVTEAVGLALKVSGATAQEAASAMLQFSQAMGSGKLGGEEFNAVAEAAPRLMQALADSLNVPRGALKKMASDGELTADVLQKALTGIQLDKLRNEFTKIPQTVDDAMVKVKNGFLRGFGVINESGGNTQRLSNLLSVLANNAETVAQVMAVTMAGGLGLVAAKATSATVAAMANAAANKQLAQSAYQAALAEEAAATAALRMTAGYGGGAAAAARLAVAQEAVAASSAALAGGANLVSRAVGLLGGPLGVVLTLLSAGAAAWSIWGSSAKKAGDDALMSTKDFVAQLENRNRLMAVAPDLQLAKQLEQETDTVRRAAYELAELKQSGAYQQGLPEATAQAKALADRIAEGGRNLTIMNDEAKRLGANFVRSTGALDELFGKTKAGKFASDLKELQELTNKAVREANGDPKKLADAGKYYDELFKKLKESASATKEESAAKKAQTEIHRNALAILKEEDELHEKIAKAGEDRIAHAIDGYKRQAEAANAQAISAEAELEGYGLTESALSRLKAARLEEAAATLKASTRYAEGDKILHAQVDALNEEAAAWRRVAAAKRGMEDIGNEERENKEQQDAAQKAEEGFKKAAAEVAAEWKRTVESIDGRFRDGFVRMLESGKASWASFASSLRNTFKSVVADAIYKYFAQPFVFQAVASVAGAFGMSGMANAAAAPNGGAMGMVGNAASIYNATSKIGSFSLDDLSAAGLFSSFAKTSFGQSLGLSTAAPESLGSYSALDGGGIADLTSVGQSAQSFLSSATTFVSWATVAIDAFQSFKTGEGWGKTVGAAIGTYILPGIGTIIGSLLGSAVDKLFGSHGGDKIGGSATGGIDSAGHVYAGTDRDAFWSIGPNNADSTMQRLVQITASTYQLALLNLGGKSSNIDFQLGFDSDPLGTADNRVTGVVRDAKGNTLLNQQRDIGRDKKDISPELELESQRAIMAGLLGADLPKEISQILHDGVADAATATKDEISKTLSDATFWQQTFIVGKDSIKKLFGEVYTLDQFKGLQTSGENLQDTFKRLSAVFETTNLVALALGKNVDSAFGAAGDTSRNNRADLANLVGGPDNLKGLANSYYNNFFTEDEKKANLTKQLNASFTDLGITGDKIPTTIEGFRKLAESLDLTDPAQRKMAAGLLLLNDTFAQVHGTVASVEKDTKALDAFFKGIQRTQDALGRTDMQNQMAAIDQSVEDNIAKLKEMGDESVSSIDKVKALGKAQQDKVRTDLSKSIDTDFKKIGKTDAQLQMEAIDDAFAKQKENLDGARYSTEQYAIELSKLTAISNEAKSKLQRNFDQGIADQTATVGMDGVAKSIYDINAAFAKNKETLQGLRGAEADLSSIEALRTAQISKLASETAKSIDADFNKLNHTSAQQQIDAIEETAAARLKDVRTLQAAGQAMDGYEDKINAIATAQKKALKTDFDKGISDALDARKLTSFQAAAKALGDTFDKNTQSAVAFGSDWQKSFDLYVAGMQDLLTKTITGFDAESTGKSLFDAVFNATNAEDAGKRFSEAFATSFRTAMLTMVTDQVGRMVFQNILTPMTNAALTQATTVVAGGTAAGTNIATGGIIAGGKLAEAVGEIKKYLDAMATIMKDPAIKEALNQVQSSFASVGSATYTGMSDWGGAGYGDYLQKQAQAEKDAQKQAEQDAKDAAALAKKIAEDKSKLAIDLLKTDGKTYEATIKEREAVIQKLIADGEGALVEDQQKLFKAQDAANTQKLGIDLLNAQGKAVQAVSATREQYLRGLSQEDAKIQRQIYSAEDATKTRDLELKKMELQGRSTEVLAANREKELATLSDTDQAIQKSIYALEDLATAFHTLQDGATAYKNLLTAQGDDQGTRQVSTNMAEYNVGRSLDLGAAAFGVNRDQAAQFLLDNGVKSLEEGMLKYWDVMSDTQRKAVTAAVQAKADYINAIKEQFNAAIDATKTLWASMSSLRNVIKSIDADIATIRIDQKTLSKSDYLKQQQADRQAELITLLEQSAGWDEIIAKGDEVRQAMMSRYDFEKQSIADLTEFASTLGDYVKKLKTGDLSALSTLDKIKEAQRQYADTLAAAKAGDKKAQGKLTGDADTLLKLSRDFYGTTSGYTDIFEQISNDLVAAGADTQTEVERQTSELTKLNNNADQTLAALQGLRSQALIAQASLGNDIQKSLDSSLQLGGILKSLGADGAITQTLKELPSALASMLGVLTAKPIMGTPTPLLAPGPTSGPSAPLAPASSFVSPVNDATTSDLFKLATTQGASAAISQALALGYTPLDIADAMTARDPSHPMTSADLRAWAKANNIQGFDVGTNYVPQDMLAVIHQGERIIPRADNDRLFAALDFSRYGREDNAALVAEIRALRQELEAIKANTANTVQAVAQTGTAIAKNTRETAENLDSASTVQRLGAMT